MESGIFKLEYFYISDDFRIRSHSVRERFTSEIRDEWPRLIVLLIKIR